MKLIKIILMLALCFILAMGFLSCGKTPVEDGGSVNPSVTVTGIWVGKWTSAVNRGFRGNFAVTLSQDGANLTGIILFTNACFFDAEVSGTYNGTDISFVATEPTGEEQVTFSGTVNNNQISGNQSGTGGTCANQDGTFLLYKSESNSNCFEEQPTSGCDDTVCQDVVCALDSFCCNDTWDLQCVDEAIDNCTS
jgi:hypothetical protein